MPPCSPLPHDRAGVLALAPRAVALGLRLVVCEDTAVIVEDDAARRGRGVYVIALGSATELAIEIPHSFSDLHTLAMGASCSPPPMPACSR